MGQEPSMREQWFRDRVEMQGPLAVRRQLREELAWLDREHPEQPLEPEIPLGGLTGDEFARRADGLAGWEVRPDGGVGRQGPTTSAIAGRLHIEMEFQEASALLAMADRVKVGPAVTRMEIEWLSPTRVRVK